MLFWNEVWKSVFLKKKEGFGILYLKEISTLFGEWVWPNWWADDRWPVPTRPMQPTLPY